MSDDATSLSRPAQPPSPETNTASVSPLPVDGTSTTGRPFSAYEASRKWLDDHGLSNVPLYCLNKYGRDSFIKGSDFSLELEDYYKMTFDYAIEESPKAFRFFEHLPDLKVLVFDRPWNWDCEFPEGNYKRCFDWESIKASVDAGIAAFENRRKE